MHTIELLQALAARLAAGTPCVWVTVAATRGSTPRAPGARMVVSSTETLGSIGGGRLEQLATAHARALLAAPAGERLLRYPLGASAGQCCGGVVHLAFDPLPPALPAWLEQAIALEHAARPWVRLAPLVPGAGPLRVISAAEPAEGPRGAALDELPDELAAELLADLFTELPAGHGDAAQVLTDATGRPWLAELMRPPALHVALFGAGHVACALVEILGRLPLRVSWIDSRAEMFPPRLPANVRAWPCELPGDEIAAQPPGSAVLVMTHSHALDLELVRGWLERNDFAFLGLIGSRAKRASFIARLRARGCDEARLARLVCPVGLPGVAGKEPAVIALAVAAQLMSLRELRDEAVRALPRTETPVR